MSGFLDFIGLGHGQRVMQGMDPSKWSYNAQTSSYGGPNQYITGAIGNLNTQAGALNTAGQSALDQGNQLLDPNSQYYQKQRGALGRSIADQVSNANLQTQQMLASKGVGSGAIRSALENSRTNRIGENVNKGINSLYQQGIGQGTSLLGMGMQGLTGAGNIYGRVGQMGMGIDQMDLSNQQFNVGQLNQANQWNAQNMKDFNTMQYNHAAAQDANMAGLYGGLMGMGSSWLLGGI